MSSFSSIRFGTDGWRAVIGEEFTFENVRRVSQAIADYFGNCQIRNSKKLIVIGEGPDWKKIKKLATPNVSLLGYKSNQELKD